MHSGTSDFKQSPTDLAKMYKKGTVTGVKCHLIHEKGAYQMQNRKHVMRPYNLGNQVQQHFIQRQCPSTELKEYSRNEVNIGQSKHTIDLSDKQQRDSKHQESHSNWRIKYEH